MACVCLNSQLTKLNMSEPRLVVATSHRCAGLERQEGTKKRDGLFVQIDTGPDDGAHDIGVQHFIDGTTDVLCSHFRGQVCTAVFARANKPDKDGDFPYKSLRVIAPCPFYKAGSE